MKLNRNPAMSRDVFTVSNGGVSDLRIVKETDIGIPLGIPVLGLNGKLDPAFLDAGLLDYRPTLVGPKKTMMFAPMNFVITNYSFRRNYRPQTTHGSIEQNGPNVRFVPNISGWVSFSLYGFIYTVFSEIEYVQKPTIVGPTQTLERPTISLTTSPFQVVNGQDQHKNSDWELSSNSDFTSIIQSWTEDATNKVSLNITGLTYDKTYYVRVRHRGASLADPSEWSNPFTIRTTAASGVFIRPPEIQFPTNNATTVPPQPNFICSAFTVAGWVDTFKQVEWQLSLAADFSTIAQSRTSATVPTEWAPDRLPVNTIYYLRARHVGVNLGYSQWSSVTAFRTVNLAVNAPQVTSPVNGAVDVAMNPTLTLAAPVITGALTHLSTDWQVSKNSTFTDIAFERMASTNLSSLPTTGLPHDTQYYVRARFNMSESISSAWSATSSFKLVRMGVNAPTITSPTANAQSISTSPTFSSSAFASTGGVTHTSTSWEVATDANFTSVVKSSYSNTASKTSWSTSGLSLATTYYVRVKYHGSGGFDSAWSAGIAFQTLSASINKPRVTSPSAGSSLMAPTTFTSSAFSSVGGVTHTATSWRVSINDYVIGGSANLSSLNNTSALTMWTQTRAYQSGSPYTIDIKHHGTVGGIAIESEWSDKVSFTGVALGAPTILYPAQGQREIPLNGALFRCTPFAGTGHESTEWQFRAPFGTYNDLVVWRSKPNDYTLLTHNGSWSGHGDNNFVHCRYVVNGQRGPWSVEHGYYNDSNVVFVPKPYVTYPTAGAAVRPWDSRFSASAYTGTGRHYSVEFQVVYENNSFQPHGPTFYGFFDEWTVETQGGWWGGSPAQYRVRARHRVNANVFSEWSDPVPFTFATPPAGKAGAFLSVNSISARNNYETGSVISGSLTLNGMTPYELGWSVTVVLRLNAGNSRTWSEILSGTLSASGSTNSSIGFTKTTTLPGYGQRETRANEIYGYIRDIYVWTVDVVVLAADGAAYRRDSNYVYI